MPAGWIKRAATVSARDSSRTSLEERKAKASRHKVPFSRVDEAVDQARAIERQRALNDPLRLRREARTEHGPMSRKRRVSIARTQATARDAKRVAFDLWARRKKESGTPKAKSSKKRSRTSR